MKWTATGLLCMLLLLLAIVTTHWREKRDWAPTRQRSSVAASDRSIAGIKGSDDREPSQFKSHERVYRRKRTQEETAELLKQTIIPRIVFEDIALSDVIVELRKMSMEAGIPAEDLRFSDALLSLRGSRIPELRVKELRLRNVPMSIALQYICDQTLMYYIVGDGEIEFHPKIDDGRSNRPAYKNPSVTPLEF